MQPELAETLAGVAAHGAAYTYTGELGKRLVESLRKEGGKMTMYYLAGYQATWSDPYHGTYRGYDVYTLGAPSAGGVTILECRRAEYLDLRFFRRSARISTTTPAVVPRGAPWRGAAAVGARPSVSGAIHYR